MYRHHHHRVSKDADDDRRHAVQQIRRITNNKRDGTAAKFGQIHPAQQSDGNTKKGRQQQKFSGAYDRVGHATARLSDGLRQLGEKIPVHIFTAMIGQIPKDKKE